MARYTNEMSLPDAFRLAVEGPEYTPSADRDYYLSELIGSPQIRRLREKHKDEIVEDISDHVWRLFGQATHSILYLASQHDKNPSHFYEHRLLYELPYTKKRTVKISARLDVLLADEGEIQDWKTTSVWGVKEGPKPEWTAQLNLERLMAWQHGYRVNKLTAVAILRDWSENMTKRNPDLPKKAVQTMPVEVWDLKATEKWAKGLVKRHEAKGVVECTPEERWQSATVWAVMKKGRKSALRLLPEPPDPESLSDDPTLSVVMRPGISRRCEKFCQVSRWCAQYARERAAESAGDAA